MQIELEASQAAGSKSLAPRHHTAPETAPGASPALRRYHRRINLAAYNERQRLRRQAAAKRKPLSEYKQAKIMRDARRKAVLSELAALGLRVVDMAKLVGITDAGICWLLRRYDIKACPDQRDTPMQKAIRKGYATGLSVAQIADRIGSTRGSVKVAASKMGITIKDPWLNRRGFSIPHDRRAEYREYIKLGLHSDEAGMCMGLLPRPSIQGQQQ